MAIMKRMLWIAAFVLLASPCALAFGNRDAIAQTSPQATTLAAQAAVPQVMEQTWGVQQGAPAYIASLAQTADGFLWLGGGSGLFRFDGTHFERFHASSGDQLLSTNIDSVFAPPTGGLWVGYSFGGFSFVKDGRVKNYGADISTSIGDVITFAQDPNGLLWAGTTTGVWKFESSTWKHLGVEWGALAEYTDLAFDRLGTLWVISDDGPTEKLLYLLPGAKRFQVADEDLGASYFALDADRMVVTSSIAAPSAPNHSRITGNALHAYPIFRNDSWQIVDRTNGVWICFTDSSRRLMRIQAHGSVKDALTKASTSNSTTYDVHAGTSGRAWLIDREENLWFVDENGVHRFFYVPFFKQEGLGRGIPAIAADDNGAVWIGGWGSGTYNLYRVTDGRIEMLHFANNTFWSVAYRAVDGTFWFGGNDGLWHLVHGKPFKIALPAGMAPLAGYLESITEDRAGGLWVSFGLHGLYRLAGGRWTNLGARGDLPGHDIYVEFTDSLRRVWFGLFTKNKIAMLDGDKIRAFGSKDGVRVGSVSAISGRSTNVWIGGQFGLQKFDNGRFRDILAIDEDWLLGITGIVETANGDLWLNGITGIFHIGRAEISEALKNPSYHVRGEHIGSREGLPGVAPQSRPLRTAIEGSDRRLWFSLTHGAVWLAPTRAKQQATVPPLAIQSISADDKNYDINSPFSFPAHSSSVAIHYSAISLSDPEAIRSRVRLRETDSDWHEVTTGEPVTYRNLAPGHYHFSVAVSDTNGVWSDKIANVDFTILPAWYQTNWFRVLCVCVLLLLLWALYQVRLKQLEQQFNVAIEARVNERTRIARDLHDTLLQSVQALLLRLQTVSNVLPARPDEAKRRIDRTIEQASDAITEGRDKVNELRSSVSTLDLDQEISNFARELLSGASDLVAQIHVRVEGTPRSLNPVVRDEVYRIATEAIRNAVRHSNADRFEVEIRYDEEQLRLRIGDDGGGIDPAILNQDQKTGHWGLPGMRERTKLVGGTLEVWSQLEKGTEIELSIPAASVYAITPASRWSIFSRFRRS